MRKWSQLKTRRKKLRRVGHIIQDLWCKIKHPISHAWYWLRTHTINRYHIVDCRSEHYKWGWMDRDWLMFCACFNILVKFVEKESPQVGIAKPMDPDDIWDDSEMLLHQWESDVEIRALYDWWTKHRAAEHKLADELYSRNISGDGTNAWFGIDPDPKADEWKNVYEVLERKDDEMLERLMKIRKHLWT